MILGCKFHILGIRTTLGQHIAKNLPVYVVEATMRRSLGKSWDMLQMMWWKGRRFNFDPHIDIRIMQYNEVYGGNY